MALHHASPTFARRPVTLRGRPWQGFGEDSSCELGSRDEQKDQETDDGSAVPECAAVLHALQGAWVNAENPSEQYVVTGLSVTRCGTDGGVGQFTLRWDPQRGEMQWGVHGKLRLIWLNDGLISWLPSGGTSRGWRWQRPPPLPRHTVLLQPRAIELPPWPRRLPPSSVGDSARAQAAAWSPEGQRGAYSFYGAERGAPLGQRTSDRAHPYLRPPPPRLYPRSSPALGRRYNDYESPPPWSRRRGAGSGGHAGSVLACGLSNFEVSELLFREITPEDYDLLLRLDEKVQKAPTAGADSLEKLTEISGQDLLGEQCSVCLIDFDAEDECAALPCQHNFHAACIKKWLSECRASCPLCGISTESSSAREGAEA